MKITGGTLKGRGIAVARKAGARYTSAKVREAIFDIIRDMGPANILDLFAGAGSFTLEALSRGAASATCVENDTEMVEVLQRNLATLALNKYCDVLNMDVRYAIPFLYKKGCTYDIIFMDPPYEGGYILTTMALLRDTALHKKETIFILEHSKNEPLDKMDKKTLQGIDVIVTKRYGDTVIEMLSVGNDNEKRSLR